jgi:hypothetical protein
MQGVATKNRLADPKMPKKYKKPGQKPFRISKARESKLELWVQGSVVHGSVVHGWLKRLQA